MHTDIVILGGGFAGAATAFHLSKVTPAKIMVLEAEQAFGKHASGRNAGMLRQPVTDSVIQELTVRSRQAFLKYLPKGIINPTGSLLLGQQIALEKLRTPSLFDSEILDPSEIKQRVKVLKGHDFQAGLWTSSDCVLETDKLLSFYVKESCSRGVKFLTNYRADYLSRTNHFEVRSAGNTISCDTVVNACGAWADRISGLDQSPITLRPYKRHLFVLETSLPPTPREPFIWNISKSFYLRGYGEERLFCVCDEEPDESLSPSVDRKIKKRLTDIISHELPQIKRIQPRRSWSCFRTFSRDNRPIIGPDPEIPGLYWVAALGGFGMGASWEIGRLAAECIASEGSIPELSPARFSKVGPRSEPHWN
jgi:D-arginine dehydrogenase